MLPIGKRHGSQWSSVALGRPGVLCLKGMIKTARFWRLSADRRVPWPGSASCRSTSDGFGRARLPPSRRHAWGSARASLFRVTRAPRKNASVHRSRSSPPHLLVRRRAVAQDQSESLREKAQFSRQSVDGYLVSRPPKVPEAEQARPSS